MALRRFAWVPLVADLALGACASYAPAPLDRTPRLISSARALDGATGGALRLSSVEALVLRNNPDLVAARTQLGVSEAQVLQAGLLPNPQFAASYPFFVSGPDGSDGFGLSLAQDVRSLVLRPTRREVADNAASAVHASLLWQEWQTVGKARLLFVQIVAGERIAKAIGRSYKLLESRLKVAATLAEKGNGPLADVSPDLLVSSETRRSADDLERLQLSRRHQLNAMLGLAPEVKMPLVGDADVPGLDAARVKRDLATIADRRPDLVALQYGYRSKDAVLRQEILAQFPNLVVGVLGGRDTNMVYSVGPQATFDLPVFNRNEGNIALARSTRAELQREFEARVTAAAGEVEALLSEQALLRRQLAALEPRLREARGIAAKTELAYAQGNFDERAYIDVQVSLLTQEQQRLALQQALSEQQVALATLTGAGLPRIAIPPEPPPADPLGLLRALSR